MANPDDLLRRYPDLVQPDSDFDLLQLVGDLDDVAAAFRAYPLPAAVDDAVIRRIRERSEQTAPIPVLDDPAETIGPEPPSSEATADRPVSIDHVRKQHGRWRQFVEIAAAAVIIVALTGTLAIVFQNMSNGSSNGANPTQPGIASGIGTPTASMSIWDSQPMAKALRDGGLGQTIDQSVTIDGYTMTLKWAGATGTRVFLDYSVTGPTSQQYYSISPIKVQLTTGGGATVSWGSDIGTAINGNSQEYLSWFDASSLSSSDHVALHLSVAALFVRVYVPQDWTPPAGVLVATPMPGEDQSAGFSIPGDGHGLPRSYYRVGDPDASLTIPGPFEFSFTIPVHAEAATPSSTPTVTTHVSLADAIQRVRNFLAEPNATLSGKLVDPADPHQLNTVGGLPRPDAKLFIISRQGQSQDSGDIFVVDADTGEVLEAVMPRRAGDPLATDQMRASDAIVVAQKFARAHFVGFDQLSQVADDRLAPDVHYLIGISDQAPGSAMHIFRWRERDAKTGTWLPSFVTVAVDANSGQVVLYVARQADYRGPTTAATDRDQAIQIALNEARTEPKNANATVTRAALATVLNNGQDSLVWTVELSGTVVSPIWPGRLQAVTIDAATGRITGKIVSVN